MKTSTLLWFSLIWLAVSASITLWAVDNVNARIDSNLEFIKQVARNDGGTVICPEGTTLP